MKFLFGSGFTTDNVINRVSFHFGRNASNDHLQAESDLGRNPGSGRPPLFIYGASVSGGANSLFSSIALLQDQINDINNFVSHCPNFLTRFKLIDGADDSGGNPIQNNTTEQRQRFQDVLDGVHDSTIDTLWNMVIAESANRDNVWVGLGKEASGNFRPDWWAPNPDKFVETFQYWVDALRSKPGNSNVIVGLDMTRRFTTSGGFGSVDWETDIFDPLRLSGHLQGLWIDVYDRYDPATMADHIDPNPALFVYPGLNNHTAAMRANTWVDTLDAWDWVTNDLAPGRSATDFINYGLTHNLWIGFPELGLYYGNNSSRMVEGGMRNLDYIDRWDSWIRTIDASGNLAFHIWFLDDDGGVGYKSWQDPLAVAHFDSLYGF